MGLFGRIGKWAGDRWGNGPSMSGLKSSVKGTGNLVGKIADNKLVQGVTAAALAASGVGAPAAAAIMGGIGASGGALKKGGGLRSAIGGAASGVASAATGAALAKVPGVSSVLSRVPGVGGGSLVSADILKSAAAAGNAVNGLNFGSIVGNAGKGAGMGIKDFFLGGGADGQGNFGILGDIGGRVKKVPGLSEIGGSLWKNKDALLAGAGLFMDAKDDARARGLEERGLNYATGAYDEKAKLRALALSQLMGPDQAPDLSGRLGGVDAGNPYAVRRKVPGVSSLPGV